jgi:cytochrome c-type biogenesis protein CcmE
VDLTPRTVDEPAAPARRRGNPVAVLVLVALVLAAGFVLVRGLRDATVFFYRADEAVARRDELGERRFRLQGTVQDDVTRTGNEVRFSVEANGTVVEVAHVGDPPDLFEPGIPVVLEGHWQGDRFASDRILVKHSSEYKAENPDRVEPGSP